MNVDRKIPSYMMFSIILMHTSYNINDPILHKWLDMFIKELFEKIDME